MDMTFGQAISAGFANYLNFSDRAVRSEYWYWALFTIICSIVANILDTFIFHGGIVPGGMGIFAILVNLALLLPGIAVGVRRLHDLDRTGWWLLLICIPLVGAIVLIVWFCTRGTPGTNRFGAPPLTMIPAMAARM